MLNFGGGGLVTKLYSTLVTLWTVACQAPLSMGFCSQESWSGLPFPSLGYLPYPGIEPGSPVLQTDTLTSEPPGKTAKRANTIILGIQGIKLISLV